MVGPPCVPVVERPPKRRRNGPGAGADLDDLTIRGVPHHHPARVARQAPGRFRGNVRPVLEDGLAGRVRVRQHRGIDMDNYLVPLSRGAGINSRVEGRLRQQGQGVRLLLGHRGRFRGNVRRERFRGNVGRAPLLVERLTRRVQRLQEQRPDLRRQPPPEDHRAVLVRIHVQCPARVPPGGLPRFRLPVHTAPAPNDPLDVRGGAGSPHR